MTSDQRDLNPPGVESRRVAAVRASYECFNNRDIDGVLDLCVTDVEFPDVVNDSVVLAEVVEMGDYVIVVAHHQVSDRNGGPLGSGITAVHRYSFKGDLIARMEWTGLDEVPQSVRVRLD